MKKNLIISIFVCFVILMSTVCANAQGGWGRGSWGQGQGSQTGGLMGGDMPGGNQNYATEPLEIVTADSVNTAADLEADMANAVTVTVSDENNDIKIEKSGTYIITGSASNGNITVKKGTTDVILVLQDLNLTSTTGATLSLNKETEVKVIISGEVTLTDAENPMDEESSDPDVADAYDGAALKIKANAMAYITGDGTLNLVGQAKNGIKGGDSSSLIIDGPTVNITAVNDGINVNYDITFLSGVITVSAGDDAIHSDHILTVGKDGTGPVISIVKCGEGLEATVVNIFGGDITVTASDDAVNAANKDGLYEGILTYSINMTGGNITVTAGSDGLDSNGNVNLIAGSATLNVQFRGGDAGIDYDGAYYISNEFQMNNSGGVAGPDGMGGGMGGRGGNSGWGRP